jgi:hypothetical protein
MYVGIGFIETARTRALLSRVSAIIGARTNCPVSYPSLDGEHHHKAESSSCLVYFTDETLERSRLSKRPAHS